MHLTLHEICYFNAQYKIQRWIFLKFTYVIITKHVLSNRFFWWAKKDHTTWTTALLFFQDLIACTGILILIFFSLS
jgi:hypothetical protein